ncbi:MAG: serine hydrolase [Bacteroidota bacterium]
MKIFKRLLLLLFVVLAVVVYLNYPKLNIIAGYASKNMASCVYVAERSAASVVANDNNVPLVKLAACEVSENEKAATASVYGLLSRKAVYREGLGSVLVNDEMDAGDFKLKPNRIQSIDTIPYPYGQAAPKESMFEEVDYDQLDKAFATAFGNPEVQKTRTLLVLYKGHLLKEQYADGFDETTPVLGWSMTKSILATCYGVLEGQGKLDTDWPAPIADWKEDERKNITLNHLLRMQSGLDWEEDYSKISDVTKMLFLDSDMTVSSIDKKAIAPPVDIWNYSSGTTNLLSGILKKQFRSHQEYLDFPYQQLLDKIGMYSSLLEADLNGNYVGSSYGWANTRDWARFGQLYLDRGQWNGAEIFKPEWVDYITKPTKHSDGTYGAHFWLNAEGVYPDAPRDLFSCNGYQGQYVFMIPSKNLVVVRTGLAENPVFDVNAFLAEVVKVVP